MREKDANTSNLPRVYEFCLHNTSGLKYCPQSLRVLFFPLSLSSSGSLVYRCSKSKRARREEADYVSYSFRPFMLMVPSRAPGLDT